MITREQYLMGRDQSHAGELTPAMIANADEWCLRYNALAEIYKRETGNDAPDRITSGWRPKSINDKTPGAAKGSKHLTCEAGDVDDDGPFDRWCLENPQFLAEVGLWHEHPGWTDGWCHLQIIPPRSGAHVRTFIPNENEPMTLAYGRSPVIWKTAA